MDEQGAQSTLDHGQGVVGDESRPFVEEVQVSQAVPRDHLVEATQEQLAGLGSAHQHAQAVARGIVEQEQRDPAQARCAGAEVLAVSEHALHALGIAPAPHVALTFVRPLARRQPHPPAGAPDGSAIDLAVDRDDAELPRAAHKFGHRGARITLLLAVQKSDQFPTQRQ